MSTELLTSIDTNIAKILAILEGSHPPGPPPPPDDEEEVPAGSEPTYELTRAVVTEDNKDRAEVDLAGCPDTWKDLAVEFSIECPDDMVAGRYVLAYVTRANGATQPLLVEYGLRGQVVLTDWPDTKKDVVKFRLAGIRTMLSIDSTVVDDLALTVESEDVFDGVSAFVPAGLPWEGMAGARIGFGAGPKDVKNGHAPSTGFRVTDLSVKVWA